MLLLHISDLHFKEGEVGTALDPNAHLRKALVADAVCMCEKLGRSPDAVLISGDIAYAGAAAEYEFATAWLAELCSLCKVPLAQVFTIPGNHDVVRNRVKQSIVQALHRDIKNASPISLDATVSGLLKDPDAGPLLYKSIEPYNDFAQQFFCSLLPPERTLCERELSFPDGSKLRLIGVNSTFVSGEGDREKDLCVDVAALQISTDPARVNVVLCHHPYSWLRNGDVLEDHLATVARVHLFGHVHTSRIQLNRDFVRVSASAAHPDRTEHGWEPGYNLIDLETAGTADTRKLTIKIHVRIWQNRPGQFHAKFDKSKDVFEYEISLEPWESAKTDASGGTSGIEPSSSSPGPLTEESMEKLRDISIRFFKLTASQRALIAGKLALVEAEDKDLPDFERTRRILLRAKERNLITKLENELRSIGSAAV
jgi:predicted MPP superfamily phosphohydrolase